MVESKAVAALGAFARAQKEETRRRLLEAATLVFERDGYVAPSVDDIAQEADVSRQTFYRHFDGKLAIAIACFTLQSAEVVEPWRQLDEKSARDPAAVERWLVAFFEARRARPGMLRALFEMSLLEPSFVVQMRAHIGEIVDGLAERIEAFAKTRGPGKEARLLRVDASLLVLQILGQGNSVASGTVMVDRQLLLPALARAFVDFVERSDQRG